MAVRKDVAGNQRRRGGVWPASIKCQMGNNLGDFSGLHAAIQRHVKVVRKLSRIIPADECCNRDQAAVAT